MSKKNHIEILHYLDGLADEAMRSDVDLWAKESDKNARDLGLYKTIVKETAQLNEYNPVDVKSEWDSFMSNVAGEQVSDVQLLNYVDGYSDYSQKKKVQDWVAESPINKADLDAFDLILKESAELTDYKQVDVSHEWVAFQTKITEKNSNIVSLNTEKRESVAPTAVPISDNVVVMNSAKEVRMVPMIQKYAVAASVALMLAAGFWFFNQNPELYDTFASQETSKSYLLSDGSEVVLQPNTTLRFPSAIGLKGMDERRGFIDGDGRFDVVSMPEKPFIIEANDKMGVEVFGTIFIVSKDIKLNYIENVEGSVRAFALGNKDIFVDPDAGDKYAFDGTDFTNITPVNPESEVVEVPEEYNMLFVLDHLMKVSNWRVISSPSTDFHEEGLVNIDLNQPYKKILDDLKAGGSIDYTKLTCDGCYMVTKFIEVETQPAL